ncbi:hypothetical protein Cgig2_021133 [Carnegiea gigantea]|uniref:Rab-GAP TBC domain-containing protein n=1 Tax=Carnegiea gigantea TaxID=171969 RepID=A0A9Q1QR62_9CARY|nr:hypothetical protein Cgig2_021133 [Carnegiea gigantea]
MLETEVHDLSDDADYAASQQQGSQSIMQTDSGKGSEPDGGKVVYVRDNVSIHPTQYLSERISGRLKLIKQGDALFMTWIPYKGQNSNARLSERDRNLYTIRPLPFTDVRSIRRHTPPFGWQYVIIVLGSGLAFPPLYFYNGGVKEFLATIKQHVYLVRSADDANVFIVNDFQDPLQKTLSSLELPGVISIAATSTSGSSVNQEETDGSGYDGIASSQNVGRPRHKFNDPARDLSIQVLEKFSLVTKFARETTSQLFREPSGDHTFFNEGRKQSQTHSAPEIPPKLPSHELQTIKDEVPVPRVPVPADPLEFDKLTLVWGKPRQSPLTREEWVTFLDSEGRVVDSKTLRKRIFYGGVAHELRKEVWPFLLGYYDYDSTYAEREYLRSMKKQDYEIIKLQWQSISPEQAKRFTKFRERKGLIEKDVVRTDRSFSFYDGDDNPNVQLLHDILLTYSFYNFDLGYCQRHRSKIIGEQMDFDTLLKFINELSGHIDLDATLRDAEALCICAGETGEACIPPGTPPSLPVENGLVSSQLEDEVFGLLV